MNDAAPNDSVTSITHLPENLTGDRSLELEWSEKIRAAWQKSVEGILECGRLLIEAKNSPLGSHGRWKAIFETGQLPFKLNTAERLMAIAHDPRLSKSAHVQILPPYWGTLHELTKVDDATFEAAVSDGTINPDMSRAHAKRLQPAKEKKDPDRARKFINLVDRCWESVEDLESTRDDVSAEVRAALECLESYKRQLKAEIDRRKDAKKGARKVEHKTARTKKKTAAPIIDAQPVADDIIPSATGSPEIEPAATQPLDDPKRSRDAGVSP